MKALLKALVLLCLAASFALDGAHWMRPPFQGSPRGRRSASTQRSSSHSGQLQWHFFWLGPLQDFADFVADCSDPGLLAGVSRVEGKGGLAAPKASGKGGLSAPKAGGKGGLSAPKASGGGFDGGGLDGGGLEGGGLEGGGLEGGRFLLFRDDLISG